VCVVVERERERERERDERGKVMKMNGDKGKEKGQ
jgi:hypothetical protein